MLAQEQLKAQPLVSNIIIWCLFWNVVAGWIGQFGRPNLALEPPADGLESTSKW